MVTRKVSRLSRVCGRQTGRDRTTSSWDTEEGEEGLKKDRRSPHHAQEEGTVKVSGGPGRKDEQHNPFEGHPETKV